MALKKEFSKFSLLMTAIGGIIGSGWLFGPLFAAKAAGPAAILSWIIGGILMLFIALTFAELSAAFPMAGGMARFTQLSHGTLSSFSMAWVAWLASVMVAPIETMAALQYASNYYTSLAVQTPAGIELSKLGLIWAGGIMLAMSVINCFAVRFFAASNNTIVIWKLIVPAGVILLLFTQRFEISHFTEYGGFFPNGFQSVLMALPTAGVIFSFIGYSPAIQLAAEAKNPQRAVPFAIFGAISIGIVLYIFLQIAFIGAIPTSSLAAGWKNLSFEGAAGPIAGILASLGFVWILKIIYIDAIISPLGTGYIYVASTARINMAMSVNGYMPSLMEKVNPLGSPVNAIITNFILGMCFFLPFPGWQSMVSFIQSCFVIAYAVGPIACATLRYTMPDVARPFKLPCVNLMCCLAFFSCNMIVYWTGWTIIWKMLVLMLVGYLVLLYQYFTKNKPFALDIRRSLWLVPYLIGTAIISYHGYFGGTQAIAFGYDFLLIAAFTLVIFAYAVYLGRSGSETHMVKKPEPVSDTLS